jgi:hypothetical protein
VRFRRTLSYNDPLEPKGTDFCTMTTGATFPLLEQIDTPLDLRALSEARLPALAQELRAFLIETVARTGGHFAANLGTVELTVALHYVFNTPEDRHDDHRSHLSVVRTD